MASEKKEGIIKGIKKGEQPRRISFTAGAAGSSPCGRLPTGMVWDRLFSLFRRTIYEQSVSARPCPAAGTFTRSIIRKSYEHIVKNPAEKNEE
jgi:hypothetical protein